MRDSFSKIFTKLGQKWWYLMQVTGIKELQLQTWDIETSVQVL